MIDECRNYYRKLSIQMNFVKYDAIICISQESGKAGRMSNSQKGELNKKVFFLLKFLTKINFPKPVPPNN